jgi:hypothetical protein
MNSQVLQDSTDVDEEFSCAFWDEEGCYCTAPDCKHRTWDGKCKVA